ncbi:MAG: isocitrate/isopropylmalate dehydrogenase family protein [Thermoplasmata archaeon]
MKHRIASVPGDGIGPEIVAAARKVLDSLGDKHGYSIDWFDCPIGAEHYLKTGELLSDDMIKSLANCKAILLGALGDPRVAPGILEKGILLKMRFVFDQYVNLRPVRFFPGVDVPISTKGRENLEMYFVRENTEDFYVGLGRRFAGNSDRARIDLKRSRYNIRFDIETSMRNESEAAYQIGVITRGGAERVIRFAFELAKRKGKKKVTCVDKANVLTEMYSLWRDVFSEVAKEYRSIDTDFGFVDAVAMTMVKAPERYEVLVTPNLFGDILTDLGAGIQGSLGLSPGGNINPEGISMYEPIHGSAPKYAGKGIANPIATILAGQMMLEDIGERKAAADLESAVLRVLAERKVRTPDLGGKARTMDMADAVIDAL